MNIALVCFYVAGSVICSWQILNARGLTKSSAVQLNNLELAVNLAKRGNLPGAENLVRIVAHVCY